MKRNLKKVLRKMKTREAMDKRQAKKGNYPTKEEQYQNDYYYFEDYDYDYEN